MLILSRKVDQKIKIGADITLSIIEIRGDQVKIGVEAPKSVKVFRQEVLEAIQSENIAAATQPLPNSCSACFPNNFFIFVIRRFCFQEQFRLHFFLHRPVRHNLRGPVFFLQSFVLLFQKGIHRRHLLV